MFGFEHVDAEVLRAMQIAVVAIEIRFERLSCCPNLLSTRKVTATAPLLANDALGMGRHPVVLGLLAEGSATVLYTRTGPAVPLDSCKQLLNDDYNLGHLVL